MGKLCKQINVQDRKQLEATLKSNMLPKTITNFISSNGFMINGSDLTYLNSGENSSVWKYEYGNNTYALKVFFENRYQFSLNYPTYECMKNLELNNIVKALTLFKINYDECYLKNNYDAYLMNYYEENKDNSILEMPVTLLLENINNLEADIENLSKNKIVMFDVRCKNTLYDSETSMFYISDIDMFFKTDKLGYDSLLMTNNKKLLNLINSFLIQETTKEYGNICQSFLNNYFHTTNNITPNSTSKRLTKLFSSYNKPSEFFKDNIKSIAT